MPMRGQNCSIAATLEIVGERWTLLVIRELLLGRTRFGDLQRKIGVSSNILSARLGVLVDHGLVAKRRVPIRGQVFDYALTTKGADLLPVLVELSKWGDRHGGWVAGPPRVWFHTACEHTTTPEHACSHCHERIEPGELRVLPGPGASAQQREEGLLPAPDLVTRQV